MSAIRSGAEMHGLPAAEVRALHDSAVADLSTWSTWPPGPSQALPWGDVIETAHCPVCGSTMTRLIALSIEKEAA